MLYLFIFFKLFAFFTGSVILVVSLFVAPLFKSLPYVIDNKKDYFVSNCLNLFHNEKLGLPSSMHLSCS